MNCKHRAEYLVLLGPETAPRALLFNGEHHYLAEMIDADGLMMDDLLRQSSKLREPPRGLALEKMIPPSELRGGVRCFALGSAAAA